MIRLMSSLEQGVVLRADVGIVGAGLAGIDLARHLGRQGLRVVLVESGRLEFDRDIQELGGLTAVGKPLRTHETHGDISRFLPPMYRGYCRIRQFGGTTNVWTGKWRIFDSWDFAQRPWVPHSGWPIRLEDLLPFYREAARDYGLGDFEAEANDPLFRSTQGRLASSGLEPHLFYWEKSPTRSGTRFFRELKQIAPVDVILGGTATDILLHDDLRTARAITIRSLDCRSITLEADRFVLAMGGLETPRLLLASRSQIPTGIGNATGQVGRFYMDHVKHKGGALTPGPALRHLLPGVQVRPRPRFSMSISFTEAVQRQRALPNHTVYLTPTRGIAWRRRLRAKLALEQAPNPESRLSLGGGLDALGMPRLVVDWRFTPWDHEMLAALQQQLQAAFMAAGLGTLAFGERPLTMADMMDASHPMGATRMAESPASGVVDRDCKVFGTSNLFIASSAVFPTGHAYSPTYTILALARRLGHHLVTART